MSAWIVSHKHINYLVKSALAREICQGRFSYFHDGERHPVNYENADEVGQMLLDENIASVAYRYEDCPPEERPGYSDQGESYKFRQNGATIDPVVVVKSCHCLRYQSCEHPGWESSRACAFVNALIEQACHVLPGYDDAPWGIE